MRLYTIQTLEVAAQLQARGQYFPEFDKCYYLTQENDHTIIKANWRFAYEWMTDQYNLRKGHDFSSAPVWWYTDLKQVAAILKYVDTHQVVLQAEVPNELVLLHDADLWEHGPFCSRHLGFQGSGLFSDELWAKRFDHYSQLFDKIDSAYTKNPSAMVDTWTEVFHIRRKGEPQRVHATTQFIHLGWLQKTENNSQVSEDF